MPDAGQYLRVIALNLHAPAAPVTKLAATKFVIDQTLIDRQSGRQTLDYRDERSAMRFSGGGETKHYVFLCGPLRISAISAFYKRVERRERRDTQRAAEFILPVLKPSGECRS